MAEESDPTLATGINFPFIMGNNYYPHSPIKVQIRSDSGKKNLKSKPKPWRNFPVD